MNPVRRFHRWLDRHEPLKLALVFLILPLLFVGIVAGPGLVAPACLIAWFGIVATRYWCVFVPGRRRGDDDLISARSHRMRRDDDR